MINVLVVDDSVTERLYMEHIIRSDPELNLTGSAADGKEALEMVKKLNPDVILMDIQMPNMDGYTATRLIMESNPTPIIIVSARISAGHMSRSFEALTAGAVCALEKPKGPGSPNASEMTKKINQTIKLMSKIPVMSPLAKSDFARSTAFSQNARKFLTPSSGNIEIVAMGTSTGGPPVIHTILSGLKPGFPYSILIVQHIAKGFLKSMINWLAKDCSFQVKIAENLEFLSPGTIYFAPEDFHMGVENSKRIVLSDGLPEHGVKPSVSHLFRSMVRNNALNYLGILLTGMGKDGAMELKKMKDRGAITLVQDRMSSVVYGMPGEAINLGGATHVLSPKAISMFLNDLTTSG